MHMRFALTIVLVASLFVAASWTPSARSQSPTTTAPAAATTPSAAPSQADDGSDDVDTNAPSVVVDIPDTPDTGDETDDGVDQSTPEPKPTPTPTPSPTPAATPAVPVAPAPAPVVPESTPAPEPQQSAPAPDKLPDNAQPDRPRDTPAPAVTPQETGSPSPAPTPRIDTVLPTEGGAALPPAAVAKAVGDGEDDNHGPKGTPFEHLKHFEPTDHKDTILGITGGGAVALAAAAAGLGAAGAARRGGGGGSLGVRSGTTVAGRADTVVAAHGGGGGGGGSAAYIECVELEGLNEQGFGRGWGDRSKTWRWGRSTKPVDRFSTLMPDRFAKVSPVISRVAIDGDYLRAMLGGAYALLFPMAIGLGVMAASTVDFVALPPALGFFLAILFLSVLDSMLGYTAALAFAGSVLVAGNLDNAAAFREIAGLTLIWFAMPLSAAAMRPLRRIISLRTPAGIWDRSADIIMGGLFAAWIAANQVSSLGPLSGYEVPIANHRWTIALIVMGFVVVRVLLETAAAWFYPGRLLAVEAQGECEPPRLQEVISFFIQIAVLLLVSSSWLGWGWALWVGTAVFFVPLSQWLYIEKIPYSPFIARWLPAGLVKWTFVIVGIVGLTILLNALVTDPKAQMEWAFIILPLPIVLIWGLEPWVENEPEEDEEEDAEASADRDGEDEDEDEEEEDEARFPVTWPMRLAGVPLLALSVYLVYYVIG